MHLAKATIYTWYTDILIFLSLKKGEKRLQINIASQRTNMSNALVHTDNIQRKAEWEPVHKQSISHYKAIDSYRWILISVQAGQGIHIFACTYVHNFMHARMHRWASSHICTYTCVYSTHINMQIQTPINISLIKEQTEHDIDEVCINSLGWYNANTVKNDMMIILINSEYFTMSESWYIASIAIYVSERNIMYKRETMVSYVQLCTLFTLQTFKKKWKRSRKGKCLLFKPHCGVPSLCVRRRCLHRSVHCLFNGFHDPSLSTRDEARFPQPDPDRPSSYSRRT